MIIGITGKSGSGKTTLAKFFETIGYYHISIDEIGHFAIQQNKSFIKSVTGLDCDRKELGNIIFNNREKYDIIVPIVWKTQQEIIDAKLKEHNYTNIVLDFILLPHTKYWDICDKKILCEKSDEIRKERVISRDNITEDYFNLRDKASIEYNKEEMDLII